MPNINLFGLTPSLARLGWLTTATPNPDRFTAPARVYLLRGNGVIFSGGLAILCGRLRQAGIWAEDLWCSGERWAARQLVADQRAGRLRGRVVFVGHSCGGRHALFAARKLGSACVGIDLLVCIDVALPWPVPANVRRAVNLYLTRRRVYPARPLVPAPGSSALIENIDLNAADSPLDATGLYHLNITASLAVQQFVMRRILEVVKGV
jgi:hypothetical protein